MLLFGALLAQPGITPAANPAGDLDQGSNGKLSAPTSPVDFQNGDLNSNNSHFIEGFSVPYRLILTNLTPGTHNVKIEWDIRNSGAHAFDYITHFQRLLPHTFGAHTTPETVDPLEGLGLGSPPSTTYPIPPPSSTGSPVTGEPTTSFNALPAGERVMTIYNGSITAITYVSQGSLTANQSVTQISIDFTATAETVVLAWGGHIATAGVWGHGNSAGAISGAPYHTRFIELDTSGGNQDRSMHADAVVPPPDCDIEGPSPLCANNLATYRVTTDGTNPTYAWSFVTNTTNASFVGSTTLDSVVVNTGSSSGTFTLRAFITAAEGTSRCDTTITVNASPPCSFDGPDAACASATGLVYRAQTTAGATYQWSITGNGTIAGPSTADSVTVDAGSAGSFELTLEVSKDGCSSTCDKTVTVNPQPSCAITGPDSVCADTEGLVYRTTPTTGGTYAWSIQGNGTIVGSSSADSVQVDAGAAGSFSLHLTVSKNGCSSECDKTVTVNALPTCSITGPDPVCASTEDLIYHAAQQAGATYAWSIAGNGSIVGAANVDSVQVTAGNAGSFTLTLQVTQNNCSSTCEKIVDVNPVPSCSIEGPSVCEGSSDNLFVGTSSLAGSTFSWSIAGNGTINGTATNDSVYVTAGATGSFTLSLTVSKDGCSSTCEKPVSVRANPSCSIDGPDPVCASDTSLVYRAGPNPGANFSWSITGNGTIVGSATADTVVVNAGSSGSFKLTLTITKTGCAQCTSTCDLTVTVNPLPVCSISGPDPVCASTEDLIYHATQQAGATYAWSIAGNGSIVGAANVDSVQVTAGNAGSFTLTLQVTQSNCSSTCEKTVDVNPVPSCSIQGPSVCEGSSNNLFVGTSSLAGSSFSWSIAGNGTIAGTATNDSVYVTAGATGSFTLTLTVSKNGCSSTCEKPVSVRGNPDCKIDGPDAACAGDSSLVYKAAGNPGATFSWSITGNGTIVGSSTADSVVVNAGSSGSFKLTLTITKNGCAQCTSTCDKTVEVNPVPVCSISGPPSICPNTQGIQYTASSTLQGSSFSWSLSGDGNLVTASGTSATVDAGASGSFTLSVIVSKNGCSSACSLTTEIRPVPPGFTLVGVNDRPCSRKSAGADQYLRFPNPSTGVGSLITTFADAFNSVEGLAVLPGNPQRLFGSNYDRLIEIDPVTGAGSDIGPIGFGRVSGIAFQPQTNVLFGITYGTNRLLRINITTGQGTLVASSVISGNKLNDLAFHPDGRLFVITDGTPKLYQIDPVTGAKLNKWTVTNTTLVQGLVWSPDGQTLWAVAKRSGFMDLCQLQLVGTNANAVFVDPVQHSGFTDIEALAILGTGGQCTDAVPAKVAAVQPPSVGRFDLGPNVPNPFNPTTQIQFELPEAGQVDLSVFDVRGRRVMTLFAGQAQAGRHMVQWNGRSATGERMASGVYYYTLRVGKTSQTRRMLLLK